MTQHLTERDVRDIATYARIGLTDDELVQMTTDLNSIIDTLKPITEFHLPPNRKSLERHARRHRARKLHAGSCA